jgi:hypothetical protein
VAGRPARGAEGVCWGACDCVQQRC